MVDELRLNTQFLGFDGIIGRRDFLLNIVCLCMINTLFSAPLMYYITSSAESFLDIFNYNQAFYSAPALLVIWVLLGTTAIFCVSLSNYIRRINDINGFVNKTLNIVIGCFAFLGAFYFLMPFGAMVLTLFVNFIIFLVLLFKQGKITKNYPHDFRKEFNWGAFFGTWIWGIVNKSYHTFWIWILSFTPAGFYYQLFCGLKGNEWAYKNREWKSNKEFNSSQETQTVVFAVLSVIVFPLIILIISIALVSVIALTAVNEVKTSPDGEASSMVKIEKTLNSITSIYFEGHTITENENKFYVSPQDWNKYSFSEKKNIIDVAATTAASTKRNKGKSSSKSVELPKTKIYSSTNGELLGEFILDESLFEEEKPNFKKIVQASMQAYKFYKPSVK